MAKKKKKDVREIDTGGYLGTPLLGPTSIFSLPTIKIFSSLDKQDVKNAAKKDYGKLFVYKKGLEVTKKNLKKEIGITLLREIPARLTINDEGLTQKIDPIGPAEIYTPNTDKNVWPDNSKRAIIWFAALDNEVKEDSGVIENVVMILKGSMYSEFIDFQNQRKAIAAEENLPLETFSVIYQHVTLSSEYLEDAKFPYYQLRMELALNDYKRVEENAQIFKRLNNEKEHEILMLSEPEEIEEDEAEVVKPEEEKIDPDDLPF